MRVYSGSRASGLALALVATTALIGLRLAAAPTSAGYRHAMDAGSAGDLYEAEPGRGLVLTTIAGHAEVRGGLPDGQPLALAAAGTRLLLGTDLGLFQSSDGGARWSAAAVPQGRYPAVWAAGSLGLAGGWGGHLWSTEDAGTTWTAFPTPPGADEFQALTVSEGVIFAATLQNVICSVDAGRAWQATGPPARFTALQPQPGGVLAAAWDGRLYALDCGGAARALPGLPPGVWALGNGVAATTDGLAGVRGTPLDHREVTALVSAGSSLYAGIARRPVYGSADDGHSWVQVLDG